MTFHIFYIDALNIANNDTRSHKIPENGKQRKNTNKNQDRTKIIQDPDNRTDLNCFLICLNHMYKNIKP